MSHVRNGSNVQVFDLVAPATQEVARGLKPNRVEYQGRIVQTSRQGDYGFISFTTISRTDGAEELDKRLSRDLQIHVKKNPALPDPLQPNVWVRFFIARGATKDGVEAVSARPIDNPWSA